MSVHQITITVLGTGGIGKSACIVQYTQGHFLKAYDPTIENSFVKTVLVGGSQTPVKLHINDTAGTGQLTSETLTDEDLRTTQGFVLMYSITDKSSFLHLPSILERVHLARGYARDSFDKDDVPIILVGNKCDLTDQRAVTTADGDKFAKDQGFTLPFRETSALTKHNLVEMFESLNDEVYKYAIKHLPPPASHDHGWRCVLL